MTLLEHYEAECQRVSVRYGVPVDIIKGRSRIRRHAAARALVVIAMRRHSPESLTAIGNIMGVEHTSILRTLKTKNPEDLDRYLVSVMSEEEAIRARESDRLEQERFAKEQTALAEARRRLGIGGSVIDHMVASDCPWKRRWGMAILHARTASPEQRQDVFQKHIRDLFPTTWQTPSALCA